MFVDYEKEEKWLNEKVSEGLAMTAYYFPCLYTFEDCSPGEYIYRLELLKNHATHSESKKYIRFVEESGTEHVATYLNWVYFRKKSDAGPFEVFSDLESRVAHYQRILRLWIFIGILIIILVLLQTLNIVGMVAGDSHRTALDIGLLAATGALMVWEIVMFFKYFPLYINKVKRLKRERDIRE
jgi:hypothetical protein